MKRLVRRLRVIRRASLLILSTVFWYAFWLVGIALVWPLARARMNWQRFIFCRWARAAKRILGMQLLAVGQPPEPPFFLVSNHLSYVDIIALAAHVKGVFIAKCEVAHWPVLGMLCRSMGTIFVDRSRRFDVIRVMNLTQQAIREGAGVVLFAEGTSTAGARVEEFRSSLLEPAVREQIPVSYASVSYRTPTGEPPAFQTVCWWGDMTFLPHLLGLFAVKRFEAHLVFGREAVQATNRKTLAARLHAAVQAQFIPVVQLEEQCSTAIH